MVVKPLDLISDGKKGLNQPTVKCRGREYLRIIYGPDYDTEPNLKRLRIVILAASDPSRSASSPWASRPLSGSFARNRCAEFMNVYSASSP